MRLLALQLSQNVLEPIAKFWEFFKNTFLKLLFFPSYDLEVTTWKRTKKVYKIAPRDFPGKYELVYGPFVVIFVWVSFSPFFYSQLVSGHINFSCCCLFPFSHFSTRRRKHLRFQNSLLFSQVNRCSSSSSRGKRVLNICAIEYPSQTVLENIKFIAGGRAFSIKENNYFWASVNLLLTDLYVFLTVALCDCVHGMGQHQLGHG